MLCFLQYRKSLPIALALYNSFSSTENKTDRDSMLKTAVMFVMGFSCVDVDHQYSTEYVVEKNNGPLYVTCEALRQGRIVPMKQYYTLKLLPEAMLRTRLGKILKILYSLSPTKQYNKLYNNTITSTNFSSATVANMTE